MKIKHIKKITRRRTARMTSLVIAAGMLFNLALAPLAFGESLSGSSSYVSSQPSKFQAVISVNSGTDVEKIAGNFGARLIRRGPFNYATLEFASSSDRSRALVQLRLTPGIISAEENQSYKVMESDSDSDSSSDSSPKTPDDPYFEKQWSLVNGNVQEAWDLGATGQGIVIAMIDTGVALEHPDLKDNLVPGYNAITESSEPGADQDDNGHGTHVAGIAAAEQNESGIVGVAYQAEIMPVKVADAEGEAYDDTIAGGIVWAVDHGAKIINLSIGSDRKVAISNIYRQAIAYAYNKGCLLVAAAGNYDPDKEKNPGVTYPASDDHVLAVTATDENEGIASYSTTGPQIALAAPGDRILSDWWDDENGLTYSYGSGTSMAAPFVSGEAALIWSQHPAWSRDQVVQVLESGTEDLGNPGRDNQYGYGLVNAGLAAALADKTSAESSSPAAVDRLGGIVRSADGSGQASLTVPANTFSTSVNVSVQTTSAPADLPNGASFLSPVFQVDWENAVLQNMLTLEIDSQALNSQAGGEIYHWDGSRWIALNGEVNESQAKLGLYRGGIYTLGTSQSIAENTRFAGTTAEETAIQIAQATFPTGADTVILAQANQFPDALAGAPLAYKMQAPILLSPNSGLTDELRAELTRLAPRTVYLLGGTAALSSDIENELQQSYEVKRLAGYTAEGTAAAIAQELGTQGRAVVASGAYFQDALVISSWAARQGMPILLTQPYTMSQDTQNALRNLNVIQTLVIGGTAVVGTNVMDKLPCPQRLSGQTAYDTESAVLNAYPPAASKLEIATGENYPDALTGAVRAAFNGSMVVLVPTRSAAPAGLAALLQSWQGKVTEGLGGTSALPEEVLQTVSGWVQ